VLNSETDFVARFRTSLRMGNDLCLHIAAIDPTYLDRDAIPSRNLEKERENRP